MLVLSRRADEKVVFPSLGISVNILRTNASVVRIGIDAPPEISVLRGELIPHGTKLESLATNNQTQLDLFKEQSVTMRSKIHQAAEALNRLHATAEWAKTPAVEKNIMDVFSQLKDLDQQVSGMSNDPAQSEPSNQSKPKKQDKRADGKVRALLVDDNDNEVRLLSSYLRIKGVEVSVASDGQQAMKKIETDNPDVVLLDMNMPEFDGRWTIDQIRHDRQLNDLTVFAVSGTPATESDVKVGPGGVNSWFHKPLNPENLVSAIVQRMDSLVSLN